MSMVCPRCEQVFEQQVRCRECNCPLEFSDALTTTPGKPLEPALPPQHTPWTKIAVGLVLSLGLSYGLQQLCTAWLLVGPHDHGTELGSTLGGMLLLHALQGVSLLIGGAITGAGQGRGILYGLLVGLLSGGCLLAVQHPNVDELFDLLVLTQPLVHAFFGMLGGLAGTRIWQPSPVVLLTSRVPAPPRVQPRWTVRLLHGPIYFGRVIAGVCIVVAGVVWSSVILDRLLRAGNGSVAITSQLQARLIGWEIAGLATLLGAGLAGAATFNGFKQGVCVGIGAAAVIIGVQLGNDKLSLDSFVGMLGSVIVLSVVGGWFGGQLFPPILATPRRRFSTLY